MLNADTVIILDNEVNTATLASVIDFDGGDRVSSSRIVAMTRAAAWATGSETLLAGAVKSTTLPLGTELRPVGENVDTATSFSSTPASQSWPPPTARTSPSTPTPTAPPRSTSPSIADNPTCSTVVY
ncbi:MAG: hypothetical protein R2856_27455 [Caldilineaceae bacterium]